MNTIDKINDYIHEQILIGNKDIVINMDNYTNIAAIPIIIIPSEVSSITFNQSSSNTTFYEFGVFTAVRSNSNNLAIFINNLKMNAKDNIAFDLRGQMNAQYITSLNFSGSNIVKSESNNTISTAGHTVEILGKSVTDKLQVYGGGGIHVCAAIGNSSLWPENGSLTFKGYGTVEAYGGNGGGKDNSSDDKKGFNGGFAIGYVTSTPYPTTITITEYINVIARGGDGQNIQSADGATFFSDVTAGDGGNGISAGICGKIIKSSSGTLTAIGGNGGNVVDESYGNSGDGGHALIINGGEIVLNSNSILTGGQGGSGSIGGKGGSSIVVLDTAASSTCKNYVSLKNNITASSGDGGDGSTSLYFDDEGNFGLMGGDGGSGGNIIDLGDTETVVIADNLKGTIGSGGNGGSPYDDYPDFVDPNGKAGDGGNTGQYLKGGQVLDDSNGKTTNIIPGTAGAPGRKQPESGVIESGIPGIVLNPIEINGNLKAPVKFDMSGFVANVITSNSENIMINQRLNYNLMLQEIDVQANYDASTDIPIIYGEAVMSLLANIIINQYENKNIVVYSK